VSGGRELRARPVRSQVLAHLRRYSAGGTSGVVTLRFDDGPLTDWPFCRILTALQLPVEIAVPASFVGRPLRWRVEQLRALVRAGHVLANHSFSHAAPPKSLDEAIADVHQADRWFEDHHLPVWTFVQPGSWRPGGGPGDLGDPERARTFDGALSGRFVCIEGYTGEPLIPVPIAPERRLGLPHVTLDDISWSFVEKLLARIVSERLFVQIVVHTVRSVRGFRGTRLAGRLARLIARCAHLDTLGHLRWVSLLSGVVAGTGEDHNLIDIGRPCSTRLGKTTYETVEPLMPGVPYRLEWRSANAASRAAVEVRERSSEETVRLVARRRGLRFQATFGVHRSGDWQLCLPESAAAPSDPRLIVV